MKIAGADKGENFARGVVDDHYRRMVGVRSPKPPAFLPDNGHDLSLQESIESRIYGASVGPKGGDEVGGELARRR